MTLARVDGDPVSVAAAGRGYLVVDAAGNALLRVTARGRVQTVATFPGRTVASPEAGADGGSRFPIQSRPSSVVVGPDGAWYVGERTGFPAPAGAARIWRVVPGEAPRVWASGFTRIVDLAWSARGELYVLESGALVRVGAGGTREVVLAEGLTAPGGLAIRGTDAYVSNCGICRGTGTVVRVPLR